MNVDYLKYFLDVAETQSISQAARVNFISPQGMSRAMNELEKELGCKLLDRFSNRLVLSRSGVDLIPYAREVIKDYAALENHAVEAARRANTAEGTTSIHLLCQRLAGLSFLPQSTMKEMIKRESQIIFREIDSRETFNIMRSALPENGKEGVADIGLVTIFGSEDESHFEYVRELVSMGYEYRPYLTTYDMALIPADSPFADKEKLTREDILTYPLVSTSTILYNLLAERFGDEAITLTTAEFAFRHTLVKHNLAITFLPAISKLHIEESSRSKLVPFENTYDVQVGFIGLKENLRIRRCSKALSARSMSSIARMSMNTSSAWSAARFTKRIDEKADEEGRAEMARPSSVFARETLCPSPSKRGEGDKSAFRQKRGC